jgi:hypothetical protein
MSENTPVEPEQYSSHEEGVRADVAARDAWREPLPQSGLQSDSSEQGSDNAQDTATDYSASRQRKGKATAGSFPTSNRPNPETVHPAAVRGPAQPRRPLSEIPLSAPHRMPTGPYISASMVAPRPGTLGAPLFTGKDVTRAMEEFEDFYNDFFGELDSRACSKFARYSTESLRLFIEAMPEYRASDWITLRAALMREFRGQDSSTLVHKRAFLEELCKKTLTYNDDLDGFCRDFQTRSRYISDLQMDAFTRVNLFISCLPEGLSNKVSEAVGLDSDDPKTYERVDKVIEVARKKIRAFSASAAFRNRAPDPRLRDIHRSMETRPPTVDESTIAYADEPNDEVARLTQEIEALKINFAQQTRNRDQVRPAQPPPTQNWEAINVYSNDNVGFGPQRQVQRGVGAAWDMPRVDGCYFCQDMAHIASECPAEQWLTDNKIAYRGEWNRWYPGTRGQGHPPLDLRGTNQTQPKVVRIVMALRRHFNRAFLLPSHLHAATLIDEQTTAQFSAPSRQVHPGAAQWNQYSQARGNNSAQPRPPIQIPEILNQTAQTRSIPSSSMNRAPISLPPQVARGKEAIEVSVKAMNVSWVTVGSDEETEEDWSNDPALVNSVTVQGDGGVHVNRNGSGPQGVKKNVAKGKGKDRELPAMKNARFGRLRQATVEELDDQSDEGEAGDEEMAGTSDYSQTPESRHPEESSDRQTSRRSTTMEPEADGVGPAIPRAKRIPRTLRLDRALQKKVDVNDIFEKAFLKAEVKISVEDLFGAAPAIARKLYERIPVVPKEPFGDVAAQSLSLDSWDHQGGNLDTNGDTMVGVRHVRFTDSHDFHKAIEEEAAAGLKRDLSAVREPFAVVPSPHVEAMLGQVRFRQLCLIDCGSECNLIGSTTVAEAGIPVFKGVRLALNGIVGRGQFIGLCDDLLVSVGGVEHRVPFLVCPGAHRTILGRPWERVSRLRVRNHDDGSWEGTIFSRAGEPVNFTAVYARSECRTAAEIRQRYGVVISETRRDLKGRTDVPPEPRS